MARIKAKDVCVRFPLFGAKTSQMSGPPVSDTLIKVNGKPHVVALNNLTFDFNKGQRIGIVGRNGSGKSTLLKVLGGIYSPTGGVLSVEGQTSSLFNLTLGVQPDATGRENIVIRGLVKGWTRREIKERVPEIIEFSELGDFIDFPLRTYSDGMKMRLLFAIATSYSPEILILDEWIGAGDIGFQKKAAERMNNLVSSAGITVIASHSAGLLQRVCDVGVWLDKGKIVSSGPINDILGEFQAHQNAG